jgi:DNA repair exonuclease SbcCD ATPase subunit
MIDEQTPTAVDTVGFGSLTQELAAQHERLVDLVARCREEAASLEAREGRLREHEESLNRDRGQLADERRNLGQWRDELEGEARKLEDAERRIVEANERVAALAAFGRELVERFDEPAA